MLIHKWLWGAYRNKQKTVYRHVINYFCKCLYHDITPNKFFQTLPKSRLQSAYFSLYTNPEISFDFFLCTGISIDWECQIWPWWSYSCRVLCYFYLRRVSGLATFFSLSHLYPCMNLLFFVYQQDPNGGYAGGPGQASNYSAFSPIFTWVSSYSFVEFDS